LNNYKAGRHDAYNKILVTSSFAFPQSAYVATHVTRVIGVSIYFIGYLDNFVLPSHFSGGSAAYANALANTPGM